MSDEQFREPRSGHLLAFSGSGFISGASSFYLEEITCDYLYGERAYIILSLVAKSLLAWQIFVGTLRP